MLMSNSELEEMPSLALPGDAMGGSGSRSGSGCECGTPLSLPLSLPVPDLDLGFGFGLGLEMGLGAGEVCCGMPPSPLGLLGPAGPFGAPEACFWQVSRDMFGGSDALCGGWLVAMCCRRRIVGRVELVFYMGAERVVATGWECGAKQRTYSVAVPFHFASLLNMNCPAYRAPDCALPAPCCRFPAPSPSAPWCPSSPTQALPRHSTSSPPQHPPSPTPPTHQAATHRGLWRQRQQLCHSCTRLRCGLLPNPSTTSCLSPSPSGLPRPAVHPPHWSWPTPPSQCSCLSSPPAWPDELREAGGRRPSGMVRAPGAGIVSWRPAL